MPFAVEMNTWFVMISLIICHTTGVSYNQPKFCSNASWNESAITFADGNTISSNTYGIFINTNSTVYVADRTNSRIMMRFEGSVNFTNILSVGLKFPYSLFVGTSGDIYVDNGYANDRVDMWRVNETISVPVLQVIQECYSIFVDLDENLYCSMQYLHQVVKKPLNDSTNTLITMFGTGCSGLTSTMLNRPVGIFVDAQLNLYVADSGNDRIQLFPFGQTNAITVAGNGSGDPFPLNTPTAIVLDADENLFIVDQKNHRIVRSGPNGLQCIIGCARYNNATVDQLNLPRTLSFDSYGNIFVMNNDHRRIQKFLLSANTCNDTNTPLQRTITSTIEFLDFDSSSCPSSQSATIPPFILASSSNQPKFCSNTSWNPNGTTLLTIGIYSTSPIGIFIDIYNTIYVADRVDNRIIIWPEGSSVPTRNRSANFNFSYDVFVTFNGDMYIDNGKQYGRVEKWTFNATNSTPALYVAKACYSLFVDRNENLYCSIKDLHRVIKKSASNDPNTSTIVAGTGCAGMTSYMLKDPVGIFVDDGFNLYVADSSNNRIQRFEPGKLNGITVAGYGAKNTIALYSPTDVALDADGYLFIVDQKNHRIVRLGPFGFQCIIGCTGYNGSAANQLLYPRTLGFDTYGNIYVADTNNNRIQKFILATNSCDKISTLQSSIITTTISSDHTISAAQGSSIFIPPSCPNRNLIGTHCNISALPCDALKPCQNNGTCTDNNTDPRGYTCSCSSHFNGSHCQNDNRPCKPHTCWNKGVCNETSDYTFQCLCEPGWTGIHCETRINYCENITCENRGVCRPLLLNFTCECLGTSYSGRYCEITATKTIVYQTVSKSFGYIAILFLVGVVLFIVVMDVLKYVFGIDPTKDELERIRRVKLTKRRRPPPVIQRFHVHESSTTTTIEETTV